MRKIKIIGDIDEASYALFSDQLDDLESQSEKLIDVELTSTGGEGETALAYVSRIRLSPCDIRVTVYGSAQSAASIILAVGDCRRITAESWVMIHEDSISKFSGAVQEVEAYAKRLRQLEDQWAAIFAYHCDGDLAFWQNMHAKERYFTAQECLNLRIVDEII